MVALLLVFIFGYIADPIINLYIDPLSATSASRLWTPIKVSDIGEERPWLQHFHKGLASLGVLSFARVLLMANPWHWYNLRNSGLTHGTARPGATGQDRVANISWIVLLVGVMTFLYTVFKAMNSLTRWFLEKAAFHIKEVPHDDDDIRPPASTQTRDSDIPEASTKASPEFSPVAETSNNANGNGISQRDACAATTTSADILPQRDSGTSSAHPVIPGAFEAAPWSFSNLDS